jgi:MYXO-CTERM domain-containing protein
MRRRLQTSLIILLAGCSYDPAALDPDELAQLESPILNGSVDNGHPAVGLLTTQGWGFCTATLVGTRTVLTAAHCVVTEKQPPYTLQPQLGWSPDGSTIYPAASVTYHPGYDAKLHNDVAVVRLAKAVTGITPMQIATTAPAQGETVTLVGYGYTADKATETFGTKRKTHNLIGKVTPTDIVFYGATGSVGNICNGDSGGPAFAMRGGKELLVGIHSFGIGACGIEEHDARSDVHRGWIAGQAQGNLYQGGPLPDTQPPQVQILSPSSQAQLGPSFSIQVQATDDRGISRVEFLVNGQLRDTRHKASSVVFQVANLPPGTHNLRVEALDQAGHRASSLVQIVVAGNAGGAAPTQPPPQGPQGQSSGSEPNTPGEHFVAGGCSVTASGSAPSPFSLLVLLALGLGLLARRRR